MLYLTRNAIIGVVVLDILAIVVALYAFISLNEPEGYAVMFQAVAQKHSENRLSEIPEDLRRHSDRLWSALEANEISRQKAVKLGQVAFSSSIILFSANLLLLSAALKNIKA